MTELAVQHGATGAWPPMRTSPSTTTESGLLNAGGGICFGRPEDGSFLVRLEASGTGFLLLAGMSKSTKWRRNTMNMARRVQVYSKGGTCRERVAVLPAN